MNLIYRSIWNDKTGTFVAASENAPSAGKKAGSCVSAVGCKASFALKALAVSLMLSFGAASYALPTGGVVAAGAAVIASTASTTTITQSTQNAVINWQSFGIAAGQTVQFAQPNSSSVALNRVLGANPSAIFGNLAANGQVFLVNPGGILFGSGASVNVGGLVASTLNITDANFMAGRYIFSNPGSGTVVNQGAINADGGYVALLGTNVRNQGTISARLGTVALAAGNGVTLDLVGDKLLNVTVDQGALNALVENGGMIKADGGMVLMTAQGAGNLLSTVVNNTGVIRAQTLSNINGTIKLLADMGSGTVNISGTLDASGRDAGQTGGSVTATAHHVGLFGGHIDASGDAGGGTVLVGGGYQGNNPSVQNALATYMSTDSSISADAITNGNGGTVVLWANNSTRAYGRISARGGAQGGNGGLVETSGYSWLDVAGIKVTAGAPNGKNGLWLLDPADITIGLGATTGATVTAGVFEPNSGASTSNIDVNQLANALGVGGAGTDITITTTNSGAAGGGAGDITIASALSWSPTTPTTLTLIAARDVNINAAVTTTRGNLVVCCGRDVNVNASITTTNGSVLLAAGRDVNVLRTPTNNLAGISTTSGNIMMCAARDIRLSNTFDGAALVTLVTGSATGGEDLANSGVPRGLSLRAGTGSTGPGAVNGTVIIAPGTILTVTGPAGISPIDIVYNPTSYLAPTDYSGFFATGNGGPLTQRMLVFPAGADKVFDGTTAATFTSLKADSFGNLPAGVTLAGAGTFDTPAVGVGKLVTFSGLTLGGASAANFALPANCCGTTPRTGRTTGNITQVVAGPLGGLLAGAFAGASTFFLPMVPPRSPGSPLITASLESPASMYFVESQPELPPQSTPQSQPEARVELPPEVPPPFVAPVRTPKQGRQ